MQIFAAIKRLKRWNQRLIVNFLSILEPNHLQQKGFTKEQKSVAWVAIQQRFKDLTTICTILYYLN